MSTISKLARILLRRGASLLNLVNARGKSRASSADFWRSNDATPYFRKHEDAILKGEIPDRYARIAPFVRRPSVVDIGCGEGLLPLALSNKADVLGIDVSNKRIKIARGMQKKLHPSSIKSVTFSCENAVDFLLSSRAEYESVVFNRSFYHFSEDIPKILIALKDNEAISEIILVGNDEKRDLRPEDHDLGPWIIYSQIEGMVDALSSIGFACEIIDDLKSDPIVRGERPNIASPKSQLEV